MIVLVCGGRDYSDEKFLNKKLKELHAQRGFTKVIHGHASGADTLAGRWARENNIPVSGYRANWQRYGRSAGPIRNQHMLEEGKPELVVAFPGGLGTYDMTSRAKKAGIEVIDLVVVT